MLKSITISSDTTVTTVYGEIEGARKGHNTKHRGQGSLDAILCMVNQTREYLCGTQLRGETTRNSEVARLINKFPRYLNGYQGEVSILGDGEFMGWPASMLV